MKPFSLLSSLDDDMSSLSKKRSANNIRYDEYTISLFDDTEKTIYIPTKNSKLFETYIEETTLLTENEVKKILRKCNGVTKI